MTRVLIGTSGYVYTHWRGRFYPRTLPRPPAPGPPRAA
jgi:uncharacterized protein YecE (DUF72 family)